MAQSLPLPDWINQPLQNQSINSPEAGRLHWALCQQEAGSLETPESLLEPLSRVLLWWQPVEVRLQ